MPVPCCVITGGAALAPTLVEEARARLGDDVLFDCDLSAQREPVGRANKSM